MINNNSYNYKTCWRCSNQIFRPIIDPYNQVCNHNTQQNSTYNIFIIVFYKLIFDRKT